MPKNPQYFIEYADGLDAEPVTEWDNKLFFDTFSGYLQIKFGEIVIDRLENVEDSKGNAGVPGRLTVTNMRLIFELGKNGSSNLSVGLSTIYNTNVQPSPSKLRTNSQSIFVFVKSDKMAYEFIFTYLIPDSPRMFITVQSIIKAYQSSRLYRDLKIRGAFIYGKQLQLLPEELVEEQLTGVWNLSGEQGHLGSFIVTNIRLVWHSMMNDVFNMSLPFRHIISIKANRSNKFGESLVIYTSPSSGKYTLGFRIDPVSRLRPFMKKLIDQWKIAYNTPIFGVSIAADPQQAPNDSGVSDRMEESLKITEDETEEVNNGETESKASTNNTNAYMIAQLGQEVSIAQNAVDIVIDPYIGLAIERLPGKMTSKELWQAL